MATPIGNLRDITLRALDVLRGCDLIACEDTRVTAKLAGAYGLTAPRIPYHDHNGEQARPRILAALAAGQAVALVSDGGTPLVSDPGYRLVRAAVEAGHPVTALPGPSAVLAALALAGLPTDRFLFAGFLPRAAGQRRAALAELVPIPATLVFFESGPRLAASLKAMAELLGDRPAAIARELTKLHEQVRRGTLAGLAAQLAGEPPPKGEVAVVVGPPAEPEPLAEVTLDGMLAAALRRASLKGAVAEVAAVTGLPRGRVYARALVLRGAPG